VRAGVDLLGQEAQCVLGDRGDVLRHEPEEAHRAQRDGKAEPVRRAALVEDQGSVD